MLDFSVSDKDSDTGARAAELVTPHGRVRTPAFMPVGTTGTVKGISAWELERLAPQMVLSNTYHLLLRPGLERLERIGGLHRLLGWNGPILTDSGGYQVFSLAACRRIDDDGVTFRSHIDGNQHRLTPENVVDAQSRFGVDVAMVLDECLSYPAEPRQVEGSVQRSAAWARRSLTVAEQLRQGPRQGQGQGQGQENTEETGWRGGLFAIQQGSTDRKLRRHSSEQICELPFDGFAVGGLAVGEPREVLYEAIAMAAPMLPAARPRYLMGVGYPEDILHAVACGIDLFDCVLPTRSARTGKVFTSRGELVIKNSRFADDLEPLDPDCRCPTCRVYSRACLRHLFVTHEVTSVVALTVHNLFYFLTLMQAAREAIMAGRYTRWRADLESVRAAGNESPGSAEPGKELEQC